MKNDKFGFILRLKEFFSGRKAKDDSKRRSAPFAWGVLVV